MITDTYALAPAKGVDTFAARLNAALEVADDAASAIASQNDGLVGFAALNALVRPLAKAIGLNRVETLLLLAKRIQSSELIEMIEEGKV